MRVIDKLILEGRAGAALPAINRRFESFLTLVGYNLHLIAVVTPENLAPMLEFLEHCLQAREARWFQPQILARMAGPYDELEQAAPILRRLDLVAFPLTPEWPRWAALQPPEAVLLLYRDYRDAEELAQDRLLPLALRDHPRALALVRLSRTMGDYPCHADLIPAEVRRRLLLMDPEKARYWNGHSFVPDPSLFADGQGRVEAIFDGDILHCRRGSRTRAWTCRNGAWWSGLARFLEEAA